MKKIKKITALLTSAIMAISSLSAVSFAEPYSKTVADYNMNRAIQVDLSSEDNSVYGNGETINVVDTNVKNYSAPSKGNYTGGDYICHTDTLETDDAIDTFVFDLPNPRTVIFRLISSNTDYAVILCPYDPTTGDITLNGPYVFGGGISVVSDFNSDGQTHFCAVVLNTGSNYGDSYTFCMNAQSNAGAIAHINSSGDLARNVFQYSTGYKMNGNSLSSVVDSFLDDKFANNTIVRLFDRHYEKYYSGSVFNICDVYVSSHRYDLDETNMSLVNYTATNVSSPAAIIIPIDGYSYYCHRHTNVAGNNVTETGVPDGNLVYDIVSNTIIDWDSDLNFFYRNIYYSETRTYSILSSSI